MLPHLSPLKPAMAIYSAYISTALLQRLAILVLLYLGVWTLNSLYFGRLAHRVARWSFPSRLTLSII
jgi:hypothetical protein